MVSNHYESIYKKTPQYLAFTPYRICPIGAHSDHKSREYGTVTIAAPVTIDGQRGNMAVVVKQTTDNFYKVHRILTPDGSVFEMNTNEAEPTPGGGVAENGSLARPSDKSAYI